MSQRNFLGVLFSMVVLSSLSGCSKAGPLPRIDPKSAQNWFVLLGADAPNLSVMDRSLHAFDMVILDPDSFFPLEALRPDTIRIAYVSVGEAENYRSYWNRIHREAWVLGENPDWEGNFYVDVRNPKWRELLIREVIPRVRAKGFDGVFMDTLDTAAYLESIDPVRYEGCRKAMIELVGALHQTFPDLLLFSNNGFDILKEIAPLLKGVVVEDLHGTIDFEQGGYRRVSPEERAFKVARLTEIREEFQLPVFIIDYAPKEDRASFRQYRRDTLQLGFQSYVAEKDLSEIYAQEM